MARMVRQEIAFEDGRVGVLTLPAGARGLILFAHGSGSNRLSPRNTMVALDLQERGFGTLLFDLLTEEEAVDRRNVFDIPLLGSRVEDAIAWVRRQRALAHLALGLFGSSTGAAAALHAAARHPSDVAALVSRGGRPDLAGADLPDVRAATLLIVGGLDTEVIALNRDAMARMRCEARLAIVPGATHLFEERGALEHVTRATVAWFETHLPPATSPPGIRQ